MRGLDAGQIGVDPLDKLEHAVLAQPLTHHPASYTLAEPEAAVEEAAAALARCGLVNRWDTFIVPSRAALRFDELAQTTPP